MLNTYLKIASDFSASLSQSERQETELAWSSAFYSRASQTTERKANVGQAIATE